jgi:hypothetical protein
VNLPASAHLDLEDSLRILFVIASEEPELYERAAVRWLGRLLYINPRGEYQCRACHRERMRRWNIARAFVSASAARTLRVARQVEGAGRAACR